MAGARGHDWTTGPAKWAAVILLGGASIFGMAWSITMRRPLMVSGAPPISASVPTDVPQPSEPGRVILREEPEAGGNASSASRPAASHGKPALTARLNINTATAAELELLPGIGPALAGRIIEDRGANGPFKSVDDLDRVKGIGPKTLDRLRDLCTVE